MNPYFNNKHTIEELAAHISEMVEYEKSVIEWCNEQAGITINGNVKFQFFIGTYMAKLANEIIEYNNAVTPKQEVDEAMDVILYATACIAIMGFDDSFITDDFISGAHTCAHKDYNTTKVMCLWSEAFENMNVNWHRTDKFTDYDLAASFLTEIIIMICYRTFHNAGSKYPLNGNSLYDEFEKAKNKFKKYMQTVIDKNAETVA